MAATISTATRDKASAGYVRQLVRQRVREYLDSTKAIPDNYRNFLMDQATDIAIHYGQASMIRECRDLAWDEIERWWE